MLNIENVKPITVGSRELSNLLGVSKATAEKIGADAGAAVTVGHRRLYLVAKVEEYLNRLAEGNITGGSNAKE